VSKPRALDLFCGAGGASVGLERAGFDVVGVDVVEQPDYPCEFVKGDALELLDVLDVSAFDLIWASPPCQFATAYQRRPDHVFDSPNLIPPTRERLERAGVPYVIENVEGARAELRGFEDQGSLFGESSRADPVLLCGSMFDLDVRRHRLFECSFLVRRRTCRHEHQARRFAPATNRTELRRTVEIGVWRIPLDVQQRAMGIDWITDKQVLSQAIPPAFSEYLANEYKRGVSK